MNYPTSVVIYKFLHSVELRARAAPYWQPCLEEKAVLANVGRSGPSLMESPRHMGGELEPSRILSVI